jgi:FdhE protein
MTTQKLLQPDEIVALGGAEPTQVHLPTRATVFVTRAVRLETLERGHAMGPYLGLVAKLARNQDRLLNNYPGTPQVPDPAAIALAKEHGMPPIPAQSWTRDPSWRVVLRSLCESLRPELAPEAQATVDKICSASPEWLEDQATRILTQRALELDRGAAVFIAGALQVYWTRMATSLGEPAFRRLDVMNVCPCCGAQPVAGILRQAVGGMLRYLSCSLCASEWYLERIKCVQCGTTEGIQYMSLEASSGMEKSAQEKSDAPIKAETCDKCQTYFKVFYTDKDHHMEPVADDLASIALDFLLADTTNYARVNPNLALFPGEDESSDVVEVG